jgi:hypothetical protein
MLEETPCSPARFRKSPLFSAVTSLSYMDAVTTPILGLSATITNKNSWPSAASSSLRMQSVSILARTYASRPRTCRVTPEAAA